LPSDGGDMLMRSEEQRNLECGAPSREERNGSAAISGSSRYVLQAQGDLGGIVMFKGPDI